MVTTQIPQGSVSLLDHPVAHKLLASSIPARLGYVALDGSPRVTPIWFTWNGTELVFGAAGTSLKVAALRRRPAVAVTIDTETAPYEVLSIRGRAEIEIVDGAVEECAESSIRYLGPERGAAFRDHVRTSFTNMARITVEPQWVGLIDFQTRFPSSH